MLTIQDLGPLQDLTDSVPIASEFCEQPARFFRHLSAETAAAVRADPEHVPSRYLSTRTQVRAGAALRAIAVYDKIVHDPRRPLAVLPLEAERARYKVLCWDERALQRRFERWFPELGPERPALAREAPPPDAPVPDASIPDPPTPATAADAAPPHALLEELEVMLLTVAELVTFLDGTPMQWRLDAIEILERLLLEAGIAPPGSTPARCRGWAKQHGARSRGCEPRRGRVGPARRAEVAPISSPPCLRLRWTGYYLERCSPFERSPFRPPPRFRCVLFR